MTWHQGLIEVAYIILPLIALQVLLPSTHEEKTR